MLLGDVLLGAGLPREALLRGEGAATVARGITNDSRRVADGSIFVCVRGATSDGHSFAGAAVAAGATIIPLRLYLKDGRAKLEIALAKGKKEYDKRETIKQREADRETRAAVKARR